jgi:HEAT repeat protein
MQIWSLNLKKCSIAEKAPLRPAPRTRFALVATLLITFFSVLPSYSEAPPLSDVLLRDMKALHSNSFQELLTRWEVRYGTDAYAALGTIARDRKHEDSERYIAVMGMAKIGGVPSAPQLTPFLKDPSWMVRNAGLQAISALKNPDTTPAVLPLLKDPALVIRVQAVDAIAKLKPEGYRQACIDAVKDSGNYYRGKAQWVPQKALTILRTNAPQDLNTRKNISLQLTSIARKPQDKAMQPLLLLTLERVSGLQLNRQKPLTQALAQLESQLKN